MQPQPYTTPELMMQIELGAAIAISISGGKDSQALLSSVLSWYRANNLTNQIFAIHADLGRAEWAQTEQFVQDLCESHQIQLVVVSAMHNGKKIDLLDKIELRQEQLKKSGRLDVPIYPSMMQRYCTSDLKTDPINAYFKQQEFPKIISVEGIRWDESKARSQKLVFQRRDGMKRGLVRGFTWNAIAHFKEADVLKACGMSEAEFKLGQWQYKATETIPSNWKIHPAYAMGNTRLSCAICVLASKNDFLNGIKHNPQLADWISQKEDETGFTYQQGISIKQGRARLAAQLEQTMINF
jgi:3'-phosphoadenosine 5'-phosphosulfate sulfotransferase (PAPS reductase)/FAD synthetase